MCIRDRASLNFLAELSPQIHAPIYAATQAWPTNHWADKPMASVAENRAVEAAVITRMQTAGVLTAPTTTEQATAGRVGSQD